MSIQPPGLSCIGRVAPVILGELQPSGVSRGGKSNFAPPFLIHKLSSTNFRIHIKSYFNLLLNLLLLVSTTAS